MYSIRQTAEMTGLSLDTLRYYEKLGLIKPTERGAGGVRKYDDLLVQSIKSIQCLKQSGLSLEDIRAFISDGQCFKDHVRLSGEETDLVNSRVQILEEHLVRMEDQLAALENLIDDTKSKLEYYRVLLR